eukprot:CAMPEP_0173459238 /NCGR_PEP_ID=MMETSP1357-20121228/61058_1 /TAXON_ID=77926 /ORGANISM="Hemiselmis rufescens, Strain PCC563" /LENGTH=80 /DNA_ID=CAMNT_0014426683 /DNA_START=23 /DNA_END=262 /DNA_ORIENTATION=+
MTETPLGEAVDGVRGGSIPADDDRKLPCPICLSLNEDPRAAIDIDMDGERRWWLDSLKPLPECSVSAGPIEAASDSAQPL